MFRHDAHFRFHVLNSLSSRGLLLQKGYSRLKAMYPTRNRKNHICFAEDGMGETCVLKICQAFEQLKNGTISSNITNLFSEADCSVRIQSPFLLHANELFLTPEPYLKNFVAVGTFSFAFPRAVCNLEDAIRHQQTSWEYVLTTMYLMLRALHDLHQNKVLHLDVKPSNVLVFSDGALKLADFGLSTRKLFPQTHVDIFRQTSWYRSCEFVEAGMKWPKIHTVGGITDKSDMFSLGLCFLRLLLEKSFLSFVPTGKPWEEENTIIFDYMARHLFAQQPTSKKFNTCSCFRSSEETLFDVIENCPNQTWAPETTDMPRSVLKDILELIEWCLQRDPERRCSAKDALESNLFSSFPSWTPTSTPVIIPENEETWRKGVNRNDLWFVLQETVVFLRKQHGDVRKNNPTLPRFSLSGCLDSLILISELYWRVQFVVHERSMQLNHKDKQLLFWGCFSVGFCLTRSYFDMDLFISSFHLNLFELQTWQAFVCSSLRFKLYVENWLTTKPLNWKPVSIQKALHDYVQNFGVTQSTTSPNFDSS